MTTPDWPALDPALRAWLNEAPAAPAGASVDLMREFSRRGNAMARERLDPRRRRTSVQDQTVDGPAGPIPVRSFTPLDAPAELVIVYMHGGGWVLGDLETHSGHAQRLATEAGAVVVSAGYRCAPEHQFPAAYDDCLAVTEWVLSALPALLPGRQDPPVVVAGDSAGGQLAASVAIHARDAGWPLAGQLLLYPVTDLRGRYAEDPAFDERYPSRVENRTGPGLTLAGMEFFATSYLDRADTDDWRATPLAADLAGVAPSIVHTAHLDVLRSEGAAYAQALQVAGVPVHYRDFEQLNHSYFGLGGISDAADRAATQAAHDLRELLGLVPR